MYQTVPEYRNMEDFDRRFDNPRHSDSATRRTSTGSDFSSGTGHYRQQDIRNTDFMQQSHFTQAGPSENFRPTETYLRTDYHNPPMIHITPDYGPNSLPIAGSKAAPRKFKGKYSEVKNFVQHYEKLCALKRVISDKDKIENITQYCSRDVREFLEGLSSYKGNNWVKFSEDILKYYDADRDEKRYKIKDLEAYVKKTRKKPGMKSLEAWKKYDRGFIRIAGWLRAKGKLSEEHQDFYFWKGIPRKFRDALENKLIQLDQDYDYEKPFKGDDVRRQAEKILKRSRCNPPGLRHGQL